MGIKGEELRITLYTKTATNNPKKVQFVDFIMSCTRHYIMSHGWKMYNIKDIPLKIQQFMFSIKPFLLDLHLQQDNIFENYATVRDNNVLLTNSF